MGARAQLRVARAQKAAATRARIVAAATELFVREGYLGTTMADLARAADVAVQTVYLAFGSKVAVLGAALDVAIAGDDAAVPILERPWVGRVRAEPDGPTALALFVAAAAEIIERHYPLWAVIRAGAADPELAELLARNKAARLATHTEIVRLLAAKPGFPTTLDVATAGQLVYALLSQETFGLLVVEHGWSRTAWAQWVRRHLQADLFPTAAAAAPGDEPPYLGAAAE